MRRAVEYGWTYRAILRIGAVIVPSSERDEWLTEWKSELWHLLSANQADMYFRLKVARFCMGSWRDAAWLRRNSKSKNRGQHWLRSPTQCILLLSLTAAATTLSALHGSLLKQPYTDVDFILDQLFVLGTALLIVSVTTTLRLGEYPASGCSHNRAAELRRWIFLGIKIALILPIVFCGTLDLGAIIASQGVRPQIMLVGYVLAFRWVFTDQRKRCPVCLRLLTNPVRIGQPSHTIFEWYGVEFMCAEGHGLLHVPETSTISQSTQRWLYLDSSWRSLFVKHSQENLN